jgi:hypothetical protein
VFLLMCLLFYVNILLSLSPWLLFEPDVLTLTEVFILQWFSGDWVVHEYVCMQYIYCNTIYCDVYLFKVYTSVCESSVLRLVPLSPLSNFTFFSPQKEMLGLVACHHTILSSGTAPA